MHSLRRNTWILRLRFAPTQNDISIKLLDLCALVHLTQVFRNCNFEKFGPMPSPTEAG